MNKGNIIKIVISIIVMLVLVYLAIFGLKIKDKEIVSGAKDIKFGLDINGGVTITYQAENEEGQEISPEDLEKSKAVIDKRLYAKNIYDFINVLLQGDDIKSAKYSEDAVDSTGIATPHVVLTFSDEGAVKFAAATEQLVGRPMPIYLDEEEIAAPTVQAKIESSTAIITVGGGTYAEKKAEAQEYAMLIDSGSLPFKLNVINKEYIGPYVGQQALAVSIRAGIVALALICLIMIIIYRLPGVVSTISLLIYTSLLLLIIANSGTTLTLSGIAGLILSIGMAVDGNVIIYERLKEELDKKVAYKKAFEKSFKNATSTIVDGNITSLIVALVLYILGSGMVKGFGIVLAIGIVLSLISSLLITRFVLNQFMPLANKGTFLFGLKKEKEVK